MKKSKNIKFRNIFFFIVVALLIVSYSPILPATKISHAEINESSIDSSKFIYSPTFSTFYQDKIFFIDNQDGLYYFKTFSAESSTSNYAENSCILNFDVVDAFAENHLFFILTQNDIKYIDLSKEIIEIKDFSSETFSSNAYKSIFVYSLNDEFVITLTPADCLNAPIIIIKYNTSLNSIIDTYKITEQYIIDNNLLFDMFATIKVTDENYQILYFGESKLKYRSSKLNIDIQTWTTSLSQLETPLDVNPETKIMGVNMLNITEDNDAKEYFFITYQNSLSDDILTYSKIYSYDFSQENNFKFTLSSFSDEITTIHATSEFLMTNGNMMIYPNYDENPKIVYTTISPLSMKENHIKNPEPVIDEMNTFLIKTTNHDTYLLQNPWDSSSTTILPSNTDILIIGTPKISEQTVDNLYYCLYTSKNEDSSFTNNNGYVKANLLSDKSDVSLQELKLAETVKVYPDTSVYELPSKASPIILETDGKFAVEILDTLKSYTTDSIKWIKVKIGNSIGYIDISRVNYSYEKVDFITTNASILKDGTYVYAEASSGSQIIYNRPLNKGKNVYIEGKRDTQSGYTKIKFNDDYGNEFEGFIKTENIKSDSWSQLQIIGSILIAINTGILILILIFKNKKLGKNGKNYTSEEQEQLN